MGNYFGYPGSLTGLKKRQNSPKTVRILRNKGGGGKNVCPKYIYPCKAKKKTYILKTVRLETRAKYK